MRHSPPPRTGQQLDPQLAPRLELAIAAARAAGQLTLDWFTKASLQVERKGDGSPVTDADRAAERLLRSTIAGELPDDGILGEEFGDAPGTSPYRWVLDPIDGTKSFITGVPLYTTLVAVMEGEEPKIGVIYAPGTDEMVYAARGSGSWYVRGAEPPRPARVASTGLLSEATFLTSEVRSFGPPGERSPRQVYDQLEGICRLTRTWGDAYGYLLVATGRADLMVDPEMNLWDAAALQPVVEEAGGAFSDWQGAATVHSGRTLATTPQLWEAVLAHTRRVTAVA